MAGVDLSLSERTSAMRTNAIERVKRIVSAAEGEGLRVHNNFDHRPWRQLVECRHLAERHVSSVAGAGGSGYRRNVYARIPLSSN